MFLRIRDEIRMTMAAYETLFERGVAYGTRNALTFEQVKEGSAEKVHVPRQRRTLQHSVEFDLVMVPLFQVQEAGDGNRELERQINEWKLKCELLEKKHKDLQELDDKRHQEQLKAEKRPGIWLKVS